MMDPHGYVMTVGSTVPEVLDLQVVSYESVIEVKIAAVDCIPGTTTGKDMHYAMWFMIVVLRASLR